MGALAPRVARILQPLGLSPRAVANAVGIAMSRPLPVVGRVNNNALARTVETELYYRATLIIRSAQRIEKGLRAGEGITALLNAERKWFRVHLDAQARRVQAAQVVDRTASRQGRTLGWYAVMDARTSAECRAANGTNFEIDRRPPIGYPGAVHPHCRCRPGPPHKTDQSTYDVKTRHERRRPA